MFGIGCEVCFHFCDVRVEVDVLLWYWFVWEERCVGWFWACEGFISQLVRPFIACDAHVGFDFFDVDVVFGRGMDICLEEGSYQRMVGVRVCEMLCVIDAHLAIRVNMYIHWGEGCCIVKCL